MNERIAELAEQAYRLTVIASESELHKCKIGSDYFNALEKAKFAELIIRECINVAKRQRDPQNLNYKPSERFADDLKQHFGVYND